MNEVVSKHGLSISIVSDRDLRLTFGFWQAFEECFGTKFNLSIVYHPQTDGQNEKNNSDYTRYVKSLFFGSQRNLG